MDNYFFDLEVHPKIGKDDRDFETPQALDLALINEHCRPSWRAAASWCRATTSGRAGDRATRGPCRSPPGRCSSSTPCTAFFPAMTASLPEETKFRLYVETLSQLKAADGRYIRWADVRMLRRVVRDMQFRNYSPRSTHRHWPLVRRAELRYIVPELRRAHALVNSFLPYELPIMKSRLEAAAALIDEFTAGSVDTQEAFERLRACRRFSTSCRR